MATYKSKPTVVDVPADVIASKFDDLSVMSDRLDNIPAAERERMGDLKFERDAIIIRNPQVGEMRFAVVERSPERIVFQANGMLPLKLTVNLSPVGDGASTEVTTVIDIEIPAMLRPLIGSKLQQVADTFGDMIGKIAAGNGI